MNFSYIVSKSLFSLEILKFLIVRPGVQLFNIFSSICPLFQVFSAFGKAATRTGWSNFLSPTSTVYRGRNCWLFYCLPKWESPLHLSDAALHKVLLPDGRFALQLSEEPCLCRLHPGRVTYAAPPHAAEVEKVGVAAQRT